MKIKFLALSLTLGITILGGCNDTLTQVGTGIQPKNDRPTVYADTCYMQAKTVQTDSVYARTIYGSLGEIFDPLYGNLKSDFICQFYSPENFRFEHTPLNGEIDSVDFRIEYNSWTGDSLAPMRVQLFPVTQALQKNFYTNIDPADYCNMKASFGSQIYTARNMGISDSLWNTRKNTSGSAYIPAIVIKMPKEIGQTFYNATVQTPEVFKNQQAFNNFFPGIYVTNTYGSGNILNIDRSYMNIHYRYTAKGSDGKDSIAHARIMFSSTIEVIQLNRFKNTDISHLLKPNDSISYLKSPAGVYTQLTIPLQSLNEKIKGRIISDMSLTLKALPQDNWKYAFDIPQNLLILPTDSVELFFRNNRIENNQSVFRGSYTASSRSYSFGNIANLLKSHLETNPNKDLVLSVIPVERRTETSNSQWGGTPTEYTVGISNYLKPSGVKLRTDKEAMEMRIITIQYPQ